MHTKIRKTACENGGFRGSRDFFVPHCDSFPMNREKKTLIPYIYNASNKDSF